MLPKKLQQKLEKRQQEMALRSLPKSNDLIDFSSNDYLGFAKNKSISENAYSILNHQNIIANGATGSRLLSGNHKLYNLLETLLADYHESDTALVFNSGYDANIGFFSSVPQRGDIIFYDEFIHASIRDGIKMSNAKSYKFAHNNLAKLKSHLDRSREGSNVHEIYIITESVFSMDGDTPDLKAMSELCKKHNCHLIVDEAHAVGVFGNGIVQQLNLQNDIFARIITFGKAMGCHGAVILGSVDLKSYLVNFARSLIYTTGLPPHSIATILAAYQNLNISSGMLVDQKGDQDAPRTSSIKKLHKNINCFNHVVGTLDLQSHFIPSKSAIHCAIIPGNKRVKHIAHQLQQNGFNVKPILSPTVPEGQERLRFCLHSFNTKKEIEDVLQLLKEILK